MTPTSNPSSCREAAGPVLGSWVEHRSEARRSGRAFTVVVNHRDNRALLFEGDEADLLVALDGRPVHELPPVPHRDELIGSLREDGFLTERPAALDLPTPSRRERLGRALRTFDLRWTGVQPAIVVLYRRGLRHLFGPVSLAIQAVLAVAGLVAVLMVALGDQPLGLRVQPWHVPAFLALNLVAVVVHELAHALVVVHHGRRVDAVGLRLHLGAPACYVDSVDALLLTRRQRMVQAAAGPWAEWIATSLAALCLLATGDHGTLALVLHRFVLLNTIGIVSNLLPFVGLDGYLLLSDATRQPDLAGRSRAALAAALRSVSRGHLPERGCRLAALYAVLNGGVAAALFALAALFWLVMFGPLLAALVGFGLAGWLVAAAILAIAGGPHLAPLAALVRRRADRARFRLERAWRVAAIEQMRLRPELHGLDARALGILAGHLRRVPEATRDEESLQVELRGRLRTHTVALALPDLARIRHAVQP